jgi:hypothetical protein
MANLPARTVAHLTNFIIDRCIASTMASGGKPSRAAPETIFALDQRRKVPAPVCRSWSGKTSSEYRHRMIVNAIAFAFTSLLILAGICLTMMMSHP